MIFLGFVAVVISVLIVLSLFSPTRSDLNDEYGFGNDDLKDFWIKW